MPGAPSLVSSRVRAMLASASARWVIVAVAVLACLPAVFSGLAADDFLQAAILADPASSPSDIFDAERVDITHPWWTDPTWHARFLRPVTVWSHRVDAVLWPQVPALMHVVSIAWYAALVLVTAAVLRELGGPRWAAGLALWMFALDDAHAPTVAWVAARGTVLAGVFGTAAMLLYIRARRRGVTSLGAISCFALALASSEVALAELGYLVAYALFVDSGPRRRLWALAPFFAVAVAWLLLRATIGCGTGGTGLYVEPWSDPLGFLAVVGPRVALLLSSVLGVPLLLDPLAFFPGGQQLAGVVAVIALLGLALVLAPLRNDAVARFFATALLLSAVPLATTVPQDRHTLLLGLAGFGLVSRVVVALAEGWLRSSALRVVAWAWLLLHAVLGPLLVPLRAWTPAVMRDFTELTAAALPAEVAPPVVLLAAPSDLHIMYTRALAKVRGRPHPERFHTLYTGPLPVDVVRSGPTSLELHTRGWFACPMSQVFRDAPMAVGTVVQTPDFVAEVVAGDEAGHPTTVRFTFPCVLERCRITWLGWAVDRAVPMQPPTTDGPQQLR
ncbi:MAG: hypothetical protein K1X88_08520 [Nannocystaceae bacterium]|nr:hypothetical protein [Nannocystaceae bacterium]